MMLLTIVQALFMLLCGVVVVGGWLSCLGCVDVVVDMCDDV